MEGAARGYSVECRPCSHVQGQEQVGCRKTKSDYLRDSPSPNILAAAICRPRELPGNPLGGAALARGFIAFVFALPPPEDRADFGGTAVEKLEPVDSGVAGEESSEEEGDCIGATELSLSPDGIAGADVYVAVTSVSSCDVFCFLVFLGGPSRGEAG